ncbi:MAG: protein translocase subunit SecD, partial [Clostridia bacterium]|nr:protein translocase subunit SecD [Clostridia bacterium]
MAKRITGFVAIILVIALLGYLAIFGLEIGSFKIASVRDTEDGIRRGLDLVGGSSVTFEAKYDDKYDTDNLPDDMEVAIAIMRTRLTSAGYTEAEVYQVGENRLRADVPSVSDPDELIKLLGATAQLTFEDESGKVYLTGADVKNASASYGPATGTGVNMHHVVLELKDAKKFGDVT